MDIITMAYGNAVTRGSQGRTGPSVVTAPSKWAYQGSVLPSPRLRRDREVVGVTGGPADHVALPFFAPRVSRSGAPPV